MGPYFACLDCCAAWFHSAICAARRRPVTIASQAISAASILGLKRSVDVVLSDPGELQAPVTWGVFRAVVILPTTYVCETANHCRAALLHEMAHVKRCDWGWQIFAEAMCAFYWCVPFVHRAASSLRLESEMACDDAVLSSGIVPLDYADQILELARTIGAQRSNLPVGALGMARPPLAGVRIRAILDSGRHRQPASRSYMLAAAALCTICLPLLSVRAEVLAVVGTSSGSAFKSASTEFAAKPNGSKPQIGPGNTGNRLSPIRSMNSQAGFAPATAPAFGPQFRVSQQAATAQLASDENSTLVPPEVVTKGKEATALVEIAGGRRVGSAFCISAIEGIFVTSAVVATSAGSNGSVTLILHPGETNQQRLAAAVVRSNKDLGLALLRVKQPRQLSSIELGSADDLIETATVVAFGYQVGKDAASGNDDYPAVTVSAAHVTSLRKTNGKLVGIQTDVQLDPGNSGGPVLNDKGRVIGVVSGGIGATGADTAIPVSRLAYFLNSATIEFAPPEITSANAHKPCEFSVHISTFNHSAGAMNVSLTLVGDAGQTHATTARDIGNQTYSVHTVPLRGPPGAKLLRLTAEDGSGKVICLAPDQSIVVGGKPVLLSKIAEIDMANGTRVLMKDKEIRAVGISGLDNIETRALGVVSHMNVSRSTRITIDGEESSAISLMYHWEVTQGGKYMGELSGVIPIAETETSPVARGVPGPEEMLLPCGDSGAVKRFNAQTGEFIDDFLSGSGMAQPIAVATGADGNLYVTGKSSQTVHRFNGRTGQFIDVFVPSNRNGGMNGPEGIAFGPDGNLYVSSFFTGEIKRFNGRTGAFIDNFVTRASGGLEWPAYLQFGADGNLYVVSISTNCVKEYNGATGAYIRDFVSGNGISNPNGFCFGPDGRFYLSNYNTRQIKRFDSVTGQFIDNYIGPNALVKEPTGVAFGPGGNLYVATAANDVKRFNGKTGKFMDVFVYGNNIRKPLYMVFRHAPVW